jgi:hypothetical protein
MGSPQAFSDLARAMHHARFHEALALIESLLVQMPDSSSLHRQRALCVAAIERDLAAAREAEALAQALAAPELIRVDAALFAFDQQRYCNAPAAELRTLGFSPLFDTASRAFSTLSHEPVLIRFYGDDSGDSVIVCFSALLRGRAVRLLACVSSFADGRFVLTQRVAELPIASTAQVAVCTLPGNASLAALVTRHSGECATRLRAEPQAARLAVRSLADCDRIWRMIAGA